VLAAVRELNPEILTKSGLMVGHGETKDELITTMKDLYAVGCRSLTIGQYLRPSLEHLPVVKYWLPEEFDELGTIAKELGFIQVRSGPLVRSSYKSSTLD